MRPASPEPAPSPVPPTEAEAEAALVARYAAGDAQAARILAERLVPRLIALAARMLGGDRAEAEDVAQEAMLRLWRAAPVPGRRRRHAAVRPKVTRLRPSALAA